MVCLYTVLSYTTLRDTTQQDLPASDHRMSAVRLEPRYSTLHDVLSL